MSKRKTVILIVLAILFFVIVVPICINECYKIGSGYITEWGAADVLSYYGTALGATATATAMVATITFTRKQIDRDSYLKSEKEKWSKIEAVFIDALNSINPMLPLISTMDNSLSDPSAAIITLQKYQIGCQVATDQLNAYLSTTDYPKVKILIDGIRRASEQFRQIYHEEIEAYSKLRDFQGRDTWQKTLEMESMYPNSFSKEMLTSCEKKIDETNGLRDEDIQKTIGELHGKVISAYHSTYRSLLQLKGATFETINTEIQKNANSILHLWGKK